MRKSLKAHLAKVNNLTKNNKEMMIKYNIKNILINSKTALYGAVLLLFFYSCIDSAIVFQASEDLDSENFSSFDTLSWDFSITKDMPQLDLLLQTRHQVNYPYKNLGLAVTLSNDSSIFFSDTLNIQLTNNYNAWDGDGWGSIYQQEDFLTTLYLPVDSCYNMKVNLLMNDWYIEGLTSIGFALKEQQ